MAKAPRVCSETGVALLAKRARGLHQACAKTMLSALDGHDPHYWLHRMRDCMTHAMAASEAAALKRCNTAQHRLDKAWDEATTVGRRGKGFSPAINRLPSWAGQSWYGRDE